MFFGGVLWLFWTLFNLPLYLSMVTSFLFCNPWVGKTLSIARCTTERETVDLKQTKITVQGLGQPGGLEVKAETTNRNIHCVYLDKDLCYMLLLVSPSLLSFPVLSQRKWVEAKNRHQGQKGRNLISVSRNSWQKIRVYWQSITICDK